MDTSPEAWRIQIGLLRKMSPEDRLRKASELTELVLAFSEAGIRARHPDATDREVFLRRAERTLGRPLFLKVYGGEQPTR